MLSICFNPLTKPNSLTTYVIILQLKERTTLCRSKAGKCDLEEYCHGDSEFCPSDAYVKDGTSCKAAGQDVSDFDILFIFWLKIYH